ncbi:MAG: tRNA (adenosine(37)-N6)-dimethylallyltransferase MiaA [Holosporales bacterium]|jgi:tRNA dimethylallyltransferase|nr:tRNA (adenosine(37)-N6)-dimethylallyltransferase MiaA [Holosporales bacterium]
MKKAIVIIGPTASGKTKYAINLAKELDGEIINFDSLQIYKDLKILTAHPSEEDQNLIKHKLFGYRNYNEKTDAASWARLAAAAINETFAEKKIPILTGGTGFYINTLINGISYLPQISEENRTKAIELSKTNYEQLCSIVYQNSESLKEIITRDKHRQMIRAYEVLIETGKSILEFFKEPKKKFISNVNFEIHLMKIDRDELYKRIEIRFENMLKNGAIEEVQNLIKKIGENNINNFPIFNAIGAKEILLYLTRSYCLEQMKKLACIRARHYAKRQITWLNHQL